jgi:hypothetical protein
MYDIYITPNMGRKKREPTSTWAVRLPNRLWNIIGKSADDRKRSKNSHMWHILEDWLVENGYLKDEERRLK